MLKIDHFVMAITSFEAGVGIPLPIRRLGLPHGAAELIERENSDAQYHPEYAFVPTPLFVLEPV
jgi:hypothetical protein